MIFNWSHRVTTIALIGTVSVAALAVAGIASAAGSSPSASCTADSYDGSTLTLHCAVPQATVTATKTVTETATGTRSL